VKHPQKIFQKYKKIFLVFLKTNRYKIWGKVYTHSNQLNRPFNQVISLHVDIMYTPRLSNAHE